MPDYFASPRRKLERAQKDIAEFKREWDGFVDEHPWAFITEINADRSGKDCKLRFTRRFPDIFSELAGRAIGNLRSVLDQCCYASALASGNTKPKRTAFPFGDSPEGFENALKRGVCKDLHREVVALLSGFKPYKTDDGKPLLWRINKIANWDKHAVVAPIAMLPKFVVHGGSRSVPRLLIMTASRWDPANNEIVFTTAGSEISADDEVHFSVDVALGEVEGAGTLVAGHFLDAMVREVERVLMAIEAETRRLFPAAFA